MPWQSVYADLVFLDLLWPDLTEEEGERRLTEFLDEAEIIEPDVVIENDDENAAEEFKNDDNPYGN